MLVLQRKSGEAIVMNDVIIVRILGVMGDRVKVGIEAPPDVVIVRKELLDDERNMPVSAVPITGKPHE